MNIIHAPACLSVSQLEYVETARFKDGSTSLLKDMPPVKFEHMSELPTEKTIEVDRSHSFQEILGFGGAFTEASAVNWKLLTRADQEKVRAWLCTWPSNGLNTPKINRSAAAARLLRRTAALPPQHIRRRLCALWPSYLCPCHASAVVR